jgi:hypothetical protein
MDIKNIEYKLKKYISKLYKLYTTQHYDNIKYNTYMSKTKYYHDLNGGIRGIGKKIAIGRAMKKMKDKKGQNIQNNSEENENEESENEENEDEENENEESENEENENEENENKEGDEGDEDEEDMKILKQNREKFEKEIYEIYDNFLKLEYEKKVLWLIKIIKFLLKNNNETSLIIRRIGKFNRKKDNRNNRKRHQAKRIFVEENLMMLKTLFFSYSQKEKLIDSLIQSYFVKFFTQSLIQNNIMFFEKFMNRHKIKKENNVKSEENKKDDINNKVHLKILKKVLDAVKLILEKIKSEQLEDLNKNQIIEKIDNITKPFENDYIPFIDKLNIIFNRINDLANIFAEDDMDNDNNDDDEPEMPNYIGKLISSGYYNELNLNNKSQKKIIEEFTILFRKKYLLKKYDDSLMLIIIIRKIIDELNIEISNLSAVDKELSYDKKILKILVNYISKVDNFDNYVVKILKLFKDLQQ